MGGTTEAGLLIGDRPLAGHPYYAAKEAVACCRRGDVVNAAASSTEAADGRTDEQPTALTHIAV